MTFLANLSFAQVDLYQNWYTRRCYERTRGQLFCALHYKCVANACGQRSLLNDFVAEH